jgi:cyclohexanone monooxygenase
MRDHGQERIPPRQESEDEWTKHVYETAEFSLLTRVDSWFMGVNQNWPDKKPTLMAYLGGAPGYRAKCDDEAASGYNGFLLQ